MLGPAGGIWTAFCSISPSPLFAEQQNVGEDIEELGTRDLGPKAEEQTVFQLRQENSYDAIQAGNSSVMYQQTVNHLKRPLNGHRKASPHAPAKNHAPREKAF